MAETKREVRSDELEQGSVKPTQAPETFLTDGSFITVSPLFDTAILRKADGGLGGIYRSLGKGGRLPTPQVSHEAIQGSVETFREGAD